MNKGIINERAERLSTLLASDPGVPVNFTLVMAMIGDEVVIVHNRMRGIWELPGGYVDAGETPEACARRELLEESGQHAYVMASLTDVLIEKPNGTSLRGRVFHTVLPRWTPFAPNSEIDACRLWPMHTLPTSLSAIDAFLISVGPTDDGFAAYRGTRSAPGA